VSQGEGGGAPRGNQNAKRGTKFRKAIEEAVSLAYAKRTPAIEEGQALLEVAKRIVEDALDGNAKAWEIIAERLDGKVPQAIVGDDEHDPVRVGIIEIVGVRADRATGESAGDASPAVPV
jgi:hypothetical protein